MKSIHLKCHLYVSMLALMVGLGMPVHAQAKNAGDSYEAVNVNSDENAEAMNGSDTGTDADYEPENKSDPADQKVEGYKHYYVDQNGQLNTALSSELPPGADSAATESGDQTEQHQFHGAKKNSVVSQNTDEDQPSRKLKHQSGNSSVAGADDSSKASKPSSIVRHTANNSATRPVSDSDRDIQTKLAHIRLFHHRIRRTDGEKVAADQNAASGKGQ